MLGPTLFVCYINDLFHNINHELKLFADNVKLFAKVESVLDCKSLQNDLNAISEWSHKWKQNFYPQKNVLPPEFKYYLKDSTGKKSYMNQVQCAKDLGVTIDETLNFSTHIDTIVADANRLVGLLRHSLIAMDNKCFLTLFKTLIRPNSSVWCPSTKKDLTKLEAVQRRATKMLPKMSQLSYPERLKALDLPTVTYRRLRGDLTQVFKYLQGNYDVN